MHEIYWSQLHDSLDSGAKPNSLVYLWSVGRVARTASSDELQALLAGPEEGTCPRHAIQGRLDAQAYVVSRNRVASALDVVAVRQLQRLLPAGSNRTA